MSGVLRLGNTGAGTGRSTLVAAASNDQTFSLPSAGGTLLTSNTSIPGGTITLDGATINITNGDLNVDSGTLFIDESTNRVGIGKTNPAHKLDLLDTNGATYTPQAFVFNATARIENNSTVTNSFASLAFRTASGDNALGFIYTGTTNQADFALINDGGTNGVERLRVTANGTVLVGTDTPESDFLVQVDSPSFRVASFNRYGADGSFVSIGSCRGTQASKTPLNANEFGGLVAFTGYNGSAFEDLARVAGVTETAPVPGSTPGALVFQTTAASSAAPTEQLRLNSLGNLGLGTGSNITSQSGRCFHIHGNTGGQTRIHLTTSASGSAANEGSYIVALGAESSALAGSMAFENRENRDIFFSVGTYLVERFRIRQGTDAGARLFAGIQTSGAFKVSNAMYVTRSANNGVGSGIFNSAYGAYAVTGFIHAIKQGTTDFCIVACYKSGTTTGVDTTVLANSGGLAPQATNSGGTVTFNDTSSAVKMISVIYLTDWSD